MMFNKTYGERLIDKVYEERIGTYGIYIDEHNQTPIVKVNYPHNKCCYFLLGGGIEANETQSECLIRECLEEAGLAIEIVDYIGVGDYYRYNQYNDKYLYRKGYFYEIKDLKQVTEPTELDHELVWLNVEDALKHLFLPIQRDALAFLANKK